MRKFITVLALLTIAIAPTFSAAQSKKAKKDRVFKSCKEALKAGYSHMRTGEPGYSTNLDRDKDGIACDKNK